MICRTIRAEAHTAPSRPLATLLPSAALILIICALMSGNNAQHIYPHRLQHHNKFSPRRPSRPFHPICAQTGSKNRSGQFFNIALLTIYNTFLQCFIVPSHLHPPIRPIHRRKNPTFFLFFYLGSFTQERQPCIVKPPHTRTLIHSPQLSHPLAS